MYKKFCDIQVGDTVWYVYPHYDFFEICDLQLIEKRSDSQYLFRRELCGDGYMVYDLEVFTEKTHTFAVYGKDKPFVLYADKEKFLSGLKRLNRMINAKIKEYERE